MTHLVLGYPSWGDNQKLIKTMLKAEVSFIELQIPFSDPIADGPTILKANQKSLKQGTKVKDCFEFVAKMTKSYPQIRFLIMTYYNIIFNYGTEAFIKKAKKIGIYGLIVPDLPPEEDSEQFYNLSKKNQINPIAVISPTTSHKRLNLIKKNGRGFIYSTSRVGITGSPQKQAENLKNFILKVKKKTGLPVAVGFGINTIEKAKEISTWADIIVIGSKILNIIDENPKNYHNKIYLFLKKILKTIKGD